MRETTVLSVRISKAAKRRLARIAKQTNRSQSILAAEAIEAFVAVQEQQVAGIKDALAALDRGEGVLHGDVKAWVESWDSDSEREMPKAE